MEQNKIEKVPGNCENKCNTPISGLTENDSAGGVGERLSNHVKNCLSELFGNGHLAFDMGIKTVTANREDQNRPGI